MAKHRKVDDEILNRDRISELPINLIECILSRMSIDEAARTSILSTNWRYIWSTFPKLVLDKQFFSSKRINNLSQYLKIIDEILMVHNGYIRKFILYIPFQQTPHMDIWILILSRNGIKKLTLHNANLHPYKLPSYIFSCVQLTYLWLCNCVLNPPLSFSGFSNLKILHLESISFSTNTGSLISTLPALDDLRLNSCTGVEILKSLPPNLNSFTILVSHEFQWECLESKTDITHLYIVLGIEVENVDEQVKHFDLATLLSNLPQLDTLFLDGFSLKFLAAGGLSKCLPNYGLEEIRLLIFQYNDFDQVSCALCLLSSSPNLQKLEIMASTTANDDTEQHILDYMEEIDSRDMVLQNLEIVKLGNFSGLNAELLLVKLLLLHSPSLEQIIISSTSKMGGSEELRISRKLMRFHRASAVAEIVYE